MELARLKHLRLFNDKYKNEIEEGFPLTIKELAEFFKNEGSQVDHPIIVKRAKDRNELSFGLVLATTPNQEMDIFKSMIAYCAAKEAGLKDVWVYVLPGIVYPLWD
jgi:hypothetical protein